VYIWFWPTLLVYDLGHTGDKHDRNAHTFFSTQDVRLITDRATGQSKGFAFVTMGTSEEVVAAIHGANG
jgi:hypothetical protein